MPNFNIDAFKHKFQLMVLGLTAGTTLFASADLRPIGLKFQDMAATVGGEFPQPAHQRVIFTFKNVGDQGVGLTRAQHCPGLAADMICINSVFNAIKGNVVEYQDFATNQPRYLPGKTYSWELRLKAHTLKHCQATPVWLDVKNALGQFGFGSPLANDKATLTAFRIGSPSLCLSGVFHHNLETDEADLDDAAESLFE